MKNTHEHPWAMSTRGFTWTPLSFINDAADKLGFGQLFSHFLIYYFVLLFLHLLVSFFFLFLFFILCWLGAPKNYPLPLLQNMFFSCLGMSENEVTFFPFKVTVLGSKKDTSFWDTHLPIYCFDLFWICVFVASMLCWLATSKTYPTEIYRFTLAQKASL